MSLGLLARQPVTWDSEAASYILQVETADGQSLEPGVARAINTFVIDCKTRGIWGAIKSCCLLCGARTIAGATIPLKGNAPILTSFVGNYNRETGLQRTSGNFSINRNNNADPQNNKHVAVYPTSIDYGSSDSNSRSILTGSTVSGSTFFTVNSLGLSVRVNASLNIVSNQPVFAGNLIGVSVLDGTRSQLLYNNMINIININTTTPAVTDLTLFGGGGVATSLSRVAFYSVGESVNLTLLNQCVTSLRQNFLRAISTYSISDTDAANYVRRVELADGFILENAVKIAIDNLVIGLKTDGLWSSIKACCIMSGAKTLAGILTPLVGLPPQNFNFIDAHYHRTLGLIGENNGFRYLDSRRRNNEDPQNNHHIAVYKNNSAQSLNSYFGSINTNGQDGVAARGQLANVLMTSSRNLLNTSLDSPANFNSGAGLIGIARNNSSSYEVIGNNLTATMNSVSQTPNGTNIGIFARVGGGVNNNTDARLCFYSIGEYLNLSLLDARLDTFMAALSNAGI